MFNFKKFCKSIALTSLALSLASLISASACPPRRYSDGAFLMRYRLPISLGNVYDISESCKKEDKVNLIGELLRKNIPFDIKYALDTCDEKKKADLLAEISNIILKKAKRSDQPKNIELQLRESDSTILSINFIDAE